MIATERLELHPLDPGTARAIVDGQRGDRRWHEEFPLQDDRDAAGMALRHRHETFGCFVIVERASGLVIGTIGFFGPPDPAGDAMIGYGLVPAARGFGYATEALRGIVEFASAQSSARKIVADTERGNQASQRVLEKAGFSHTHSTDEAHWYEIDVA
jgi:RimJ/RimL family protein N-acetyltransferase